LPRSLLKIADGNFKLEVLGLLLAVSWLIGKILPYTHRQFKGKNGGKCQRIMRWWASSRGPKRIKVEKSDNNAFFWEILR
jgi:hypothetical protein